MLIALSGYAGSGKNEAARILEKIKPESMQYQELSFARALKVSAARALGFAGSEDECVEFCDMLKEEGGLVGYWSTRTKDGSSQSGREFLQRYGTEAHRDVFGTDFWVDQVLPNSRRVPKHQAEDLLVVITDCRFPNEAYRVLQQNGEVWRINRDSVKPVNEHASEEPLDDLLVTREIDNNGTLEELEDNLAEASTLCYKRTIAL